MYGIVSDIFLTRPYSFFFSICPEYKIQGHHTRSLTGRAVIAPDLPVLNSQAKRGGKGVLAGGDGLILKY